MEPYSRRLPSARAAAADAVACGVFALRWDAGQVRSVKNHPLSGMTLSGLAAFLRRYGRHMQPWRFAARLYFLAALAVLNTLLAWVETLLFGLAVWRTPLQQRPVFVLGQPRSGTTHVHNLLARDERFAHATTFDVGFAHCFLWTARWLPALLRGVLSETRPMDQMALDWTLPQEDELATNVLSGGVSPYAAICALRREAWVPLLPLWTLREEDGASVADAAAWKASFLWFCRKLQYRAGASKRLLLKSPVHTARVATLCELFPRASFVCVHRDPYAIFASSLNMAQKYFGFSALCLPPSEDVLEYVLAQFELMHRAYIRDATQLLGRGGPTPRLVEIAFRELDSSPFVALDRVYEGLQLADGSGMPPAMRAAVEGYLGTLIDFKKNAFAPLSGDARRLVSTRWLEAFRDFGYFT